MAAAWAYAGWMAALTAHGVHAIVVGADAEKRVTLVPTVLAGGGGLSAVGRF